MQIFGDPENPLEQICKIDFNSHIIGKLKIHIFAIFLGNEKLGKIMQKKVPRKHWKIEKLQNMEIENAKSHMEISMFQQFAIHFLFVEYFNSCHEGEKCRTGNRFN